jgi:hypothetical protein
MRRVPCTRPRARPANAPQRYVEAWLPAGQAKRRAARAVLLDAMLCHAWAGEAKA